MDGSVLAAVYLFRRALRMHILSARDSWFSGLSSAQPLVRLPKVNAKTTEREIPLEPEFAKLLLHWSQTGLKGTAGSRWPHAGQKLQLEEPVRGKGRLLFPGRKAGGKNLRNYAKPVTSRGLHNKFVQAWDIICTQQASARAQGTQRVFDDIVLPRLSSHSCKKQLSRYSKNTVWQQAWYHS